MSAILKCGRCVNSKYVPSLCVCKNVYSNLHQKKSVLLSTAENNSGVKCIHILLKIRERDHLEDPGVDGRIILKGVFSKWAGVAWSGSSWLTIVTGGGHF